MRATTLRYTAGQSAVFLKEITGAEELVVLDEGTSSALQLLNGLLKGPPDQMHTELKAEQIVTADRDLLLAHLYIELYGDKISSTIKCEACSDPFDLDFSLTGLLSHLNESSTLEGIEVLEDATYRLTTDCRFRLPTGADELATIGYSTDQALDLLLQECLLEGDPVKYGTKVQEAMAQLAPVLQMEMQAVCPECKQEQELRFDIQSFLLNCLRNERRQTSWEIHQLAAAYQWSHQEILNLPRKLRKTYVSFIET